MSVASCTGSGAASPAQAHTEAPAGVMSLAPATADVNLLVRFYWHAFDVYAVDADGDAIIGPGAPAFSEIVTAQKADLVRVVDSTPAAPNRFYVLTIGTLGSGFPQQNRNLSSYVPPALLTITATPPAGSGAGCTLAACERGVP